MTIPTTAFDPTVPNGTTKINKGDDTQRDFKVQVQEILDVDHKMDSSGQGTDWGQHKQVTCQEQADLGTGAVDATILGSQTVDSKGELVYTDEDDNDVEITSCGYLATASLKAGAIPTGATVASANIVDDSIVDADINSSAAIDASKIADGSVSDAEFQRLDGVTSDIQTQFAGKFSIASPYSETKTCNITADTSFTHGRGHDPIVNIIVASPNVAEWAPLIKSKNATTIVIYNPSTTIDVTVQAW